MSRYRSYQMPTPVQDEDRRKCAVCGLDVDAERTRRPETAQIQRVESGTVYDDPDITKIDKTVEVTVPAYQGHSLLCGSPRWDDGLRGDL